MSGKGEEKKATNAVGDLIESALEAGKEQQRTAQKALDLVSKAAEFLGQIFNPAATELGQLLGDQMRYWRFRNLARVLGKAEEEVRSRKIPPEQLRLLPFGEAFRAIEAASFEEEEEVQALWARLIANAVDPERNVRVTKLYTDLLRSLSSAEAVFLDLLWHCERSLVFKSREEVEAFNNQMNALAEEKWRRFENGERQAALQNLVRIRCVTFRPRPLDANGLVAALPREFQSGAFARWAAVDPTKIEKLLREITEMLLISTGAMEPGRSGPIKLTSAQGARMFPYFGDINVRELNYMLTPLATSLMAACRPNA